MSYGDRPAMLAPGASGAAALHAPSAGGATTSLRAPAAGRPAKVLRAPGRDEPLRQVEAPPAVDERLIMPETRYEVVDGEVLFSPPADEPHGAIHFDLAHILGAYVAPDFRGAVDMLTRTSKTSDHAPDASIYPRERDPETGGRKLEHLAFEIVSEQALSVATRRARKYLARGVRRVFCIHVGRQAVLEWSAAEDTWKELPRDATIVDRCLVRPLPARALVDAALVDDTVARGLLAKKNRVLEEALEEARSAGEQGGKAAGKAAGKAEGKAEAVLQVLALRKVTLSETQRGRVRACKDIEELDRWLSLALAAKRARDVFGSPRK